VAGGSDDPGLAADGDLAAGVPGPVVHAEHCETTSIENQKCKLRI
jgi:hypothetical protein